MEEEKVLTRQEEIRAKGFDMIGGPINEYGRIKVGTKVVDDAILTLGSLNKKLKPCFDKGIILRALAERDAPKLREISNYFYDIYGIYSKACQYAAFLYRYDWWIYTEIYDESVKDKPEKIIKEYNRLLDYLDNTHIKKLCNDIALKVVKEGVYYGYMTGTKDSMILQQLPANYCRSRYSVGLNPVIEFNMRFFDENFKDINYRLKVLKMFPEEFQKGYMLYKKGKLPVDNAFETGGSWFALDHRCTVKFNLGDSDLPIFANAIPALIDLDAAQDLDRRKQMQELLKILIQELPLDKNGDLIFDLDEAQDIHNNAVEMLQHAIGVDVLTTFADIKVEDMADKSTKTSTDDLAKMERSVFNALGLSKNLFNAEGNVALQKSIQADESAMRNLLLQFHIFFDRIVTAFNTNKKYRFRFFMLETTQNNYENLSKMYKEQTALGNSKLLPQIALGHSPSAIVHSAEFENQILNLAEIMIPPLMSSTMNGEDMITLSDRNKQNKEIEKNEGGRPEKDESEKSDKTLANRESMG